MAFTILACSSLAVRARQPTIPACKIELRHKQNSAQSRDIIGLKAKAFAIIQSFHVLAKHQGYILFSTFKKKIFSVVPAVSLAVFYTGLSSRQYRTS